MILDLTKPVQTRDGWEVEIYNKERMHGAVRLSNGSWHSFAWEQDGSSPLTAYRSYDLVNTPPKMTKRRIYISTWGDAGWRVDTHPLIKSCLDSEDEDLIAFNFPIDIEIPEGYGL